MRDLAILFIHLLVTIARLFGPGGARSVAAESLLVKHQLLILNRPRVRAPDLRPADRIFIGLCAVLMRPTPLFLYIAGTIALVAAAMFPVNGVAGYQRLVNWFVSIDAARFRPSILIGAIFGVSCIWASGVVDWSSRIARFQSE